MELKKALYMMPVPISDTALQDVLPTENLSILKDFKYFIVENVRTARRFLKKAHPDIDINAITLYELNQHTQENEISTFLNPLRKGEPIALMSEAGVPGVADPGASVARIAQREGMRVIPLVGPSSILLALMASGLNGQQFAFNGYLPVDQKDRDKTIRELESNSRKNEITQIFIETPYRNEKMMQALLNNLRPETLLCVASDISHPENENIITKSVKEWRNKREEIKKVPTIFLFYYPNP